jgi:hypothetical protein
MSYNTITPCSWALLEKHELPSYSKISQNLMDPEVRYCVHKSPQLTLVLSQINPVRNTLSYLSKINFNIIIPLSCGFLFFLLAFIPESYRYCSYLPWVLRTLPISSSTWWFQLYWWRMQVMKLLIMQFSQTSYHFIPHQFKYSPQHPVFKHC